MQNNENQGIHTGYTAGDVFTPNSANQLARTNHYDFVITQEMLDNFRSEHSGASTVDIGALIASNADGTDGTWTTRVQCPVSIYIAAKTSWNDDFAFLFNGRLIDTSNGGILDCSDYMDDGNWDINLTDGMVNVYSEYPYRIDNLPGGFNFWSTPQNAVFIVQGLSTNGKVRVGAYGTSAVGIDNGSRETAQVICQQCVAGAGFTYTRAAAGGIPSVVYAGWMGGDVADKYKVNTDDYVKFGLYEQASASVELGASPVVVEVDGTTEREHQFAGKTATSLSFFNGDKGQNIILHNNGNIGRRFIGGRGGNEIVISDMDCPLNTGTYAISPNLTVLRNGIFVTEHLVAEKIFSMPTISEPINGLNVGGSCRIKWYTWSHGTITGGDSFSNPRSTLYICTSDMIDGLVYELDCYATSANTSNANTGHTYSPRQDGAPQFRVTFVDDTYSYVTPYKWASSQALRGVALSKYSIDLNFKEDTAAIAKADSQFDYDYGTSTNPNVSLPILARAKLMFVMLGGKLYTMAY